MSREYPAHPLPGVIAMVVRDDRLLMVRRAKEPDRGKWGFPGGLVEVGETLAQAALRELSEETGITARADTVADVFEVIAPDGEGRIRYHYILNVVACRWETGEPVAADDAEDAAWFTLDQATDPKLPRSINVDRLARLALGPKGEAGT